MSLSSATYGGVAFPCSDAGIKLPDNSSAAIEMVTHCPLTELLQFGRPDDAAARRCWMLRSTHEMHWLPVIETLSGCHPRTDPAAHTAFMNALVARGVLRIAHGPLHPCDQFDWGLLLRSAISHRISDPTSSSAVRSDCSPRLKKSHAFFVGDDCVAAAEQARPDCLVAMPWLLYKAVAVVRGQLDPDGHRLMSFTWLGDDPSSDAYWRYLKTGTIL